jgi:hypothetical protein
MLHRLFLALLLMLAAAPFARAQERFLPLQLIIGGDWDGQNTITYPSGRFGELVQGGSIWVGPKQWTHPKTGEVLTVYDRTRGGRNAADQVFAVRKDKTAIGRVSDNRFGIEACDQEGKYPLGVWRQGEKRSFEYTCWYGGKANTRVTTLTIQEIDFDFGGFKHAMQVDWVLRDKASGRELDHRIYTFAPGKGVVNLR